MIERYVTRGVQAELDLPIAFLLFDLQEAITVEKDYLCVFELKPLGDSMTEITVRQEIPSYKRSILVKYCLENPIKLFLIDSVLMLAEEY